MDRLITNSPLKHPAVPTKQMSTGSNAWVSVPCLCEFSSHHQLVFHTLGGAGVGTVASKQDVSGFEPQRMGEGTPHSKQASERMQEASQDKMRGPRRHFELRCRSYKTTQWG